MINASPSSKFIIRFGKLIRPERELTATASVGARAAAKAKAAASGIVGIIQWTKYPITTTVANTSPSANTKIGIRIPQRAALSVCLPSLNSNGAINITRKSSGFNCKSNVIGIMAINTPRPIWISGTETKGTNRLSKLEIKMATSNAKTYKNISNMYRPLSFFLLYYYEAK